MGTSAATIQTQLDAANTLLTALLGGARPVKEYSVNGQAMTYWTLGEVEQLIEKLEKRLALAGRTTRVMLGDVSRRPC
jgi:hypothetical protein